MSPDASAFRFCPVCRQWRIPEHAHVVHRLRASRRTLADSSSERSPRRTSA